MKQEFFKWVMLSFLFITFSNCNGQVEKAAIKESEPNLKPAGTSTLIKTQNSNEGDNVNCSLEDKEGHLWFGTTGEGVYVYDDTSFVQYTQSNGLKSNMVFCMHEDRDGRIWIGTDKGVSVYDGHTFEDVYITAPIHSGHKKLYVFSIMEDEVGKLWFATVEGVYIYDGVSFDLFEVTQEGRGYISEKHNTEYMLQDKDGNIWFGSRVNDGVYRYDGQSIVNFKLEELDGHKWAWPVLQDKSGTIWFSNWGGTYRYDGTSFTSFTIDDGLSSTAIMRIMEDRQGYLWFGGGAGVSRYDGVSFTHFTTQDGLPHNGVWSLLEDSKQNIWIGTRNTGLCKYDGKKITNLSEHNLFPLMDQR